MLASPTGYVGPCLSCNEIMSSAVVGSKDGNTKSAVLTTPTMSSDVKISPPATVAKTATPSKTIAKVSSLGPLIRKHRENCV